MTRYAEGMENTNFSKLHNRNTLNLSRNNTKKRYKSSPVRDAEEIE